MARVLGPWFGPGPRWNTPEPEWFILVQQWYTGPKGVEPVPLTRFCSRDRVRPPAHPPGGGLRRTVATTGARTPCSIAASQTKAISHPIAS